MSLKAAWKGLLFGALFTLLLFVALFSSHSFAQEAGTKPLHLSTGDVILQTIPPDGVKVNAAELFDGKYFRIVQFRKLPTYEMRQKWESEGLYLTDYLPEDSYFAVIDQGFDLKQLSGLVTTIAPVGDAMRFEPAFTAMKQTMNAQGTADVRLTLSYYLPLDAQKIMADLQAHGATIERHRDYSGQIDVTVPAALVDAIAAQPYIQFVGPAFDENQVILEEGDSSPTPEPEEYYHNTTGRSNYLNSGYGGLTYNGDGVTIAIGEGGTADNYVEVQGRLIEKMTGDVGHHKVGCIRNAAGGGNEDPTERNNAWGATVMSVGGNPDYAAYYNSDNLRFTNHSYGSGVGGGYCQDARNHDMRIQSYPLHIVSYSSGNVGGSTGYPPYDGFSGWANITGCYKQNKNHFAIRNLNRTDDILDWGSKGPAYDGRILPQLIIEGEEGTSYASPKVIGIMAILAQVYKDKHSGQEAPSNLLRAILMNTADDMDDPGPDFRTGYGRPNVRRAYDVLDAGQFFSSTITNTNDINLHTISVPANVTQLRVMLMWPDKAAAVNADPAIVNDLDLLITDTVGTDYLPWVLDPTPDPAKLDLPAVRGEDHLNTMEQVTVDNPAAGNWSIQIKGHNVPEGPQTYYITYEFITDDLKFMFPLKDVRLAPGETYNLKWDSFGPSGTFDLDYQIDGGSWTNITTGYDADKRVYSWTAPDVSPGAHTIKFRVTRGSATSESDINYIGETPTYLNLEWACGDTVKLSWLPAPGAEGYYIYHLGPKYMEKVDSSQITFDGTSAIVSGLSATDREMFAVSAYTGSNEGLRTMGVLKEPGDINCYNVKANNAAPVDKTNLTLNGFVNPHDTTMNDVHFEYGPDASYGSSTSNIAITVTGHAEQNVNSVISSTLTSRNDVLHYRLAGKSDGVDVASDDHETRLAPGNGFEFDGADDDINLGRRFQVVGNAPRTIAMWAYARSFSWNGLFQAGITGVSAGDFAFSTTANEDVWRMETWDWSNGTFDVTLPGSKDSWHFYAITYDGSGNLKIYYDGQLMKTTTGITLDTQSYDVYLGRHGGDMFDGWVDEASFWDIALTQGEIRELMHHPLDGSESGLLAYYNFDGRMDEAVNIIDGRNETLEGGVAKTTSSAPMGNGFTEVRNEASGTVDFPLADVSMNFTSAGSAEIIASKINVEPNAENGLPAGSDIFDEQYWVIHRDGSGGFSADVTFTLAEDLTAADESSPLQIQLFDRDKGAIGDWSFVAFADSVDAANDQATFPDITEFDKQFIIVRNPNPFITVDPETLTFPNAHPACEPRSYQLTGANLTDNVTITPSADFQVSTSATSGFANSLTITPVSGSVEQTIYVKLNDTASGVYSGTVTNASTGAETKTVTIPDFKVTQWSDYASQAMKFDGANDYLDILDLDWNPQSQFTVEFWLNPAAYSNWDQKIGNGWGEFLFESNAASAQTVDAGVNNNHYIRPSDGTLETNVWQHYAFTLDGTNAKLYKNGQLVGNISNSDTLNKVLSHFRIGDNNDYTINGLLDEFRLWDTVRTQTEIQDNMHNVITSTTPGLISYLQFNNDPADITDYSAQCQQVVAYNDPTLELSTAPVGTESKFVDATDATSVGDPGKAMTVTITSTPDANNYLGIYRTGEGDGVVTSGETFPAGVTQRANILWGVQEYGDVTADLVIDYSNVTGISLTDVKLLKRSDAASPWVDVTADFTHDTTHHTFTKTGVTDFSEFTVTSACAMAAAPADNQIELTGTNNADVLLSWLDNPADSDGYEIHRSAAPYFTPDANSLHATEPAGATSHTDSGAAGNASANYYYVILGKNSCGDVSSFEKRLGEFDFTLVPGS